MNYEIQLTRAPAEVVVTERQSTTLRELGNTMHSTLSKIATSVEPPEAARGAPFAVYYNQPFDAEDIDVEMGVAVAKDAKVDEHHGVHRRELAGGSFVSTIHIGPYAEIGRAYQALYAWFERSGRTPAGPPREIYLVGPGQAGAPKDYRTRIELPIEGDS